MSVSFTLTGLDFSKENKNVIYAVGVAKSRDLVAALGDAEWHTSLDSDAFEVDPTDPIAAMVVVPAINAVLDRAFETYDYDMEPEIDLMHPWPIAMKVVGPREVEVSLMLANDPLEPIRRSAQM